MYVYLTYFYQTLSVRRHSFNYNLRIFYNLYPFVKYLYILGTTLRGTVSNPNVIVDFLLHALLDFDARETITGNIQLVIPILKFISQNTPNDDKHDYVGKFVVRFIEAIGVSMPDLVKLLIRVSTVAFTYHTYSYNITEFLEVADVLSSFYSTLQGIESSQVPVSEVTVEMLTHQSQLNSTLTVNRELVLNDNLANRIFVHPVRFSLTLLQMILDCPITKIKFCHW